MLFDCNECDFEKEVSDKYAGKKVKCPQCGVTNLLPGKSNASAKVVNSKSKTSKDDNIYSLASFVSDHKENKENQKFELESDRILEFDASEGVWIKSGSMISYKGDVEFVRERILEFGAKKLMKSFLSTEGTQLTKAKGNGRVFVADSGKKVTLLKLNNESLYVNGNDVLAFEKGVKWDVELMKSGASILSSGFFNIKLSGNGFVAFTSHYDPLVLEVGGKEKITTDPNATVAWSGDAKPNFKAQVQAKTFLGRGSGDSAQMHFTGKGFVVVQPYEENSLQANSTGSSKQKSHPVQAIAGFVLFAMFILFNGGTKSSDNGRNPASEDYAKQVQATQTQIQRLQVSISKKGTGATEEERQKLRRLKQNLRDLQDKL